MVIEQNTWLGSNGKTPLSVRILVVEDDTFDAELILDRLTADGIDVASEVVADEAAYRNALSDFKPEVVLSDVTLPGFSGERALSLLREHDRRTPFIFVSGTISETSAIEALRAGATDYILKANMARLPAAVRRAIADAAERRARDQAESELVRAQRFETLAILAGSLSHDLRNILQPVLMATQMIESKAQDSEISRLCGMIRDCSDQGLELVSAMLALARGGQDRPGNRIKLAALMDAIGMLIKSSLPKGIDMTVGDVDPALEIPGNSNELQQCLLNLAMNAVQAMPAGGRLELSTEPFEASPEFFLENEPRSGTAYVRISVSDTGHGMDTEVLEKLFTPFFTTKDSGNGLGLVSCRRFAESHRGVIRVSSEVGVGSRFDLYLPIEVEEQLHADDGSESDYSGRGERVMVVSGDRSAMTDIVDILDLYGYDTTQASDVDGALDHVREGSDARAAIVDRDLVVGNGGGSRVNAIAQLRAEGFKGAVILFGAGRISGVDSNGVAVAHLSKPVTAPALLKVLREVLPGRGRDA